MAEIARMPSLSPTMEEGKIESWVKKVGDYVESGEVIANIETDKAIVEYEALDEGYLRHLFVNAGDTIKVGTPIALFSEEADETVEDLILEIKSEGTASEKVSGTPSDESTGGNASKAPQETFASSAKKKNAGEKSAGSSRDYDLVVVGAGPGGYVAAIRSAQLGLKTALVDKEWLGGVCLNVGCIPSKSLLKNAEIIHTIKERGDEFGFSYKNLKVDYSVAVQRSRKISEKLTNGIGFLTKKNNISVHMAHAVLSNANTLELTDLGGKTYRISSENIILATGASTRMIPGLVADGKKVLTYREAILQKTLPKSAIIVGSGAIGVEFATIWNAYGVDVTVVEMLPSIVPLEDQEISEALKKSFKKSGIKSLVNTRVEKIDSSGKSVEITISDGKGSRVLDAEQVLVAIGFVPNVQNIGLEAAGIHTEKGAVAVNDFMQTNIPNIYAIGDVTAKLMLAHVGSAMGIIAAEHIANHPTAKLNYEMMPRATYCHPQIASMGLTEVQTKERGYDVKIAKFPYAVNGKAMGLGESEGFVKIITEAKYGEILGAHLIGPDVTELLPEFTLAQASELSIDEIARNVHAHPTLSETIMEAAHGATGGYIHI
ncbi:MAG: dihydrolipoyl dehydrogenase [SAR324 cluster bacterium]|nr:dihydrolipoyl dehydrogenase [SAR324 cluster bacterium]